MVNGDSDSDYLGWGRKSKKGALAGNQGRVPWQEIKEDIMAGKCPQCPICLRSPPPPLPRLSDRSVPVAPVRPTQTEPSEAAEGTTQSEGADGTEQTPARAVPTTHAMTHIDKAFEAGPPSMPSTRNARTCAHACARTCMDARMHGHTDTRTDACACTHTYGRAGAMKPDIVFFGEALKKDFFERSHYRVVPSCAAPPHHAIP